MILFRKSKTMREKIWIATAVILLFVILVSCADKDHVYDARISDMEILTPAPGPEPRINGPKVYGVRPGKIFLYRIPCQGERPVRFEVTGLPDGISLDAEKGILSGVVPSVKGEYEMVFIAENNSGRDSRPFRLVTGERLALTPPTGWNSWGGHMVHVSHDVMRKAADVFNDRGLADVGFRYVGIDDCWMRTSPEMYASRKDATIEKHKGFNYEGIIGEIRDADGNILPNYKFPDMKAMCDHIHSYGLLAGLYSTPGPVTCQNFAGSYQHQKEDADQYARWGFDLIKYDQCSGGSILNQMKEADPGFTVDQFWKPMTDYLLTQDRDILFNLCQYGREDPWKWAPGLGIQSWRIGGDLNHHVDTYFKQAMRIATDLREYSIPGHWNDPDFMYIHRIKDVWKMNEPSEEIPLATNQRYQYVSLWSIICAPFFFSCDINEIDDFTIGLLTNADIVNINQDELGHVAEVIRDKENETVMVKNLADGSIILAVFSRNDLEEMVIDINWEEIGRDGKQHAYDVWRQKEIGRLRDGISVKLSPQGVGLFRISG
jgi:alpha-galactosidase